MATRKKMEGTRKSDATTRPCIRGFVSVRRAIQNAVIGDGDSRADERQGVSRTRGARGFTAVEEAMGKRIHEHNKQKKAPSKHFSESLRKTSLPSSHDGNPRHRATPTYHRERGARAKTTRPRCRIEQLCCRFWKEKNTVRFCLSTLLHSCRSLHEVSPRGWPPLWYRGAPNKGCKGVGEGRTHAYHYKGGSRQEM